MKKRVLSLLLCLCLCVGLFPGAALASGELTEETSAVEEPSILEIEEIVEETAVQLSGDAQAATYSVSFSDNLGPAGSALVAVNSSAEEAFSVMTDTDSLTLSAEDVVYLKVNPDEAYPIQRVLTIVGAGVEVQGFASIEEQDGIYTLSGCSMDCAIRIVFDTGIPEENGPEENGTYTVTMNVVYPEGYEGEKTGGLRVYEQTVANGPEAAAADFRAHTDYVGEMSDPVIRNVGETFWYQALAVTGLSASVDMYNAGTCEDRYALHGEVGEKYTVTVTYREGGSGNTGGSGEMGGSSDEIATEPYTITLDITYPEGYTDDNGGVQIGTAKLLGDGAAETYSTYVSLKSICPMGLLVDSLRVVCLEEHEEGVECAHVSYNEKESYYRISGNVMVYLVYGLLDVEKDFSVSLEELSPGDVGQFSALLTAEYVMPTPNNSFMYDLRIFLGTSEDDITHTYSSYYKDLRLVRNSDDTAYVYSEAFNDLLPGTTYYARAELTVQGSGQPYTHYSNILTFTTDGEKNVLPSVAVAPAEGEHTEALIPCTINGEETTIAFSDTDGRYGSDGVPYVSMVKMTVEEDGVYYFDLSFTEPSDYELWRVLCRLYRMNEDGLLQPLDLSWEDCIARFSIGEGPIGWEVVGDAENLDAYITLTAGTYYLALDTTIDLLDAEVSVSLANTEFKSNFSITANGWDFDTDDSTPQQPRALVEYSVSSYYESGWKVEILYDLASHYDETGKLRYSNFSGFGSQPVSDSAAIRISRFIEGLEHVYIARIVDFSTGEVLAESDAYRFTVTVPASHPDFIRTLELGVSSGVPSLVTSDGKLTGRYGFGMGGVLTYRFTTVNAGWYLFNANCKTAELEVMDKNGNVIAVAETGTTQTGEESYWISAKVYLEANTDYYVYTGKIGAIYPSVTISYLQGSVDMPDESLEAAEGAEQIAVDSLETTINDLTKDGEGNDAELPDYVDTDEDGEAALREAIETGDSITAEITGKELAEDEVVESVADAMKNAALVVADTETAEVLLYLDLSVLLKLGEEEIAKLTETGEEITFCIPITKELSQLIANKALYIIRYHNGEAESIALEVSERDGCIYFSSDLFSTYALYVAGDEASFTGFKEENGVLHYYFEDVLFCGGLFEVDGEYYYARTSNGEIIRGRGYWVTRANTDSTGYQPGYYTFDETGRMIPFVKNGFVEEAGTLYYYIDGTRYSGGLFEVDGEYYYARTSNGEIVRNRSYWITKTNDIMHKGCYDFAADGRIIME